MELPSLPTDNLYKFMALAGVLIFATSALFICTKADEMDTDLIRLSHEADLARRAVTHLKNQQHDFETNIGYKGSGTYTDEQQNSPDFKSITNSLATLQDATDELDLKVALEKQKANSARLYAICSISSLIGGLGIAVIGFLLWYDRVQKYQDAILKMEAQTKRGRK